MVYNLAVDGFPRGYWKGRVELPSGTRDEGEAFDKDPSQAL